LFGGGAVLGLSSGPHAYWGKVLSHLSHTHSPVCYLCPGQPVLQ
jgi:hypothetical protein